MKIINSNSISDMSIKYNKVQSNIHFDLHMDGWSRKLVWFEQIFVHILMDISNIKSNL